MGGGSLELSEALDDRVGEQSVCLPLGALPIETIMEQEGEGAKRRIDALLAKEVPLSLAHPTFFAVGGGWRAFAKAHMQATEAPVQVVHGHRIAAREARDFAKTLLQMSPAKMMELGVSRRRTRTLPAAAMLLNRVLKYLAPEHVVFSALGLREGWLYAQLADNERYLDPLVEGAQLIGLHASRVPEFAPALVSWTENVHKNEKPADTRLRVAVCALSDLGWRDHLDIRAEESYRRVLQFPFIGLNHVERAFLAVAIHARYADRLEGALSFGSVEALACCGSPPGASAWSRHSPRLQAVWRHAVGPGQLASIDRPEALASGSRTRRPRARQRSRQRPLVPAGGRRRKQITGNC